MKITERVAELFNVGVEGIESHSRKKELAIARFAAIYCYSKGAKMRNMEISRMLNRNHASIHNALMRSEDLLATSPNFRIKVKQVLNELNHL